MMLNAVTGQFNVPEWEAVEAGIRGIFSRSYFANNGPLVQELDASIARFAGVEYAVAVTNAMIAMMCVAKGVFAPGEVVVPAHLPRALCEALRWGGYRLVFADIDRETLLIDRKRTRAAVGPNTTGIVGMRFAGNMDDSLQLEELARACNLPLIFDSSDAFGAQHAGRVAGAFGKAEVFSFHETALINGAQGGCVTSRDADVYDQMRTIRNFHPGQTFTPMPLRMNAKMAEAPAMLVLASLPNVPAIVSANRARYHAYAEVLSNTADVSLLEHAGGSNFSRIMLRLGEAVPAAQTLADALANKGIEVAAPLGAIDDDAVLVAPVAAEMRHRILELPNHHGMTIVDVRRVAEEVACQLS